MNKELSFNYVIFDNNTNSFYKLTLNDLLNKSFIQVNNPPMGDRCFFERLLYKFHVSEHFRLPFKSIWNKRIFRNCFGNDKPICFLFSSDLITLKRLKFFEFLKSEYKDCKLVYYCRDLFDLYFKRYKDFDLDYIKKTFDVILNYDLSQVLKYDLTFYPDFESMIDLSKYKGDDVKDVVFVGAAKGRLDMVLNCYNYLTNNNISCDFYIVGAPKDVKSKYPGIVFSDKWLSYDQVLTKIANARCILEIIQENSVGYSARAMKAFGYNKQLITTSSTVKFTRFFDNYNVQCISDPRDINIEALNEKKTVDYHYKDEFSPIKMIEFLDALFVNHTSAAEFFSDWIDLESFKEYLQNSVSIK